MAAKYTHFLTDEAMPNLSSVGKELTLRTHVADGWLNGVTGIRLCISENVAMREECCG